MKFLLSAILLIGYSSLGYAAAPPVLTIGTINDALTEFNVGEGNTDETASLNHIQIASTSGTFVGLSNDPVTTTPGVKYYQFTILAPGCAAAGNPNVTIKTSYNVDGHLTANSTVDLELSVAAWDGTNYEVTSGGKKFGICIQADIKIVQEDTTSVVVERKHFDFLITPILSTFTVTSVGLTNNVVDVGTSTGEASGTTVTGTWKGSNPLPPGEPIWLKLVTDDADYIFTGFETVNMVIGGNAAENLIVAEAVQDSTLTSSELLLSASELHFYHILPRTKFTSSAQTLTITGKALVDYTGARRLRVDADGRELETTDPNEADFAIKALMKEDDGSGSGGFTLEILSVVIGGFGAVGVALL